MSTRSYIAFLLFCLVQLLNAQLPTDKISQRILSESDDATIPFLVKMESKADLSHTTQLKSKLEKGRYVFQQLKTHAQASQKAIIRYLETENIPYWSFFISNVICVEGNIADAKVLAAFPGVKSIDRLDYFMRSPVEWESNDFRRSDPEIPWGIKMINADKVWEMGIRGEGAVVGGQDTGYEWDHPALKQQYRGFQNGMVDHNYNWHDAIHSISLLHNDENPGPGVNPCGLDALSPCDDGSHGTHTMGTMIGESGDSLSIGVAPGARWIGVRNMERGYGSPETYLEGFEWFLAPTDLNGENPDPDKSPHVINNSWSCPEKEGCFPENFDILEEAINNLRAAGIVVVASAGNSGTTGCSSINAPAAIFEGVMTVGATNENDSLTNFSSRGPVTVDGSFRMKPNVTAPGQSVLSSISGGRFGLSSGTSMSGPHVAGVVALMISANPDLAGQVEAIEDILERTAVFKQVDDVCGANARAAQNNFYGFGRIDALAAVQEALLFTGVKEESQSPFKVFPNPVLDRIHIELPGQQSHFSIQIRDIYGRLIKEANQGFSGEILVSDLTPGTYIFILNDGFQQYAHRIIKQ